MTLKTLQGDKTRPTTDRVKEALFSRLESRGALADAQVLDLFAGSGALGLESASRGAAEVRLVDQAQKALDICRANANAVNRAVGRGVAKAVRGSAAGFLAQAQGEWDLVFVDPPYAMPESELRDHLCALLPLLAADAVVVVERSSRSPEPEWPRGMATVADKAYGETRLWFAEPVEVDAVEH